jgi:hypothetical protein
MRQTLAFTTVFTGLIFLSGAPASAATMLSTTGAPLTETVKNSSGADGTLIKFTSDPSAYVLDYGSTDILHASSTGGFAFVAGATDTGFSNLTIKPETVSFSAFKFNLQLPASSGPDLPNGYHTDFTFDTTVIFVGGGSQSFATDVGSGTGQNRYLITAGSNQAISEIEFSNLTGVSTRNNDPTLNNDFNFDSLRQVSFDAISAVPEPNTWALFILGFGAVGFMLRSAGKRVLTA